MKLKSPFCIFIVLVLLKTSLCAQSPYAILERAVSIHLTNTPLKEALKELSQAGRFELAYDARIFDLTKKITLFTNGLTVRETLYKMVGDGYNYQQNGEYLIIKKNSKPKQILSGYISDAKTGKRVQNATVYDAKTLRSTTTDENGYYSLKVAQRSTVVVAQLAYRDTILQIEDNSPRFVNLNLDIKTPEKPVEKKYNWRGLPSKVANFFTSSLNEVNNLNVRDSIRRRFQIAFLPYIGSNHAMSGNVVNDYSLNALVGYSRGNRVAEFSGIGSITREDIKGIQASGVFNIVRGSVKGVQAAGVFNFVGDTVKGVQLGGVWNSAHTIYAVNQSAGVANVALHGQLKTQFAGVTNAADSVMGVQAAGVVNHAKHIKGAQLAGVVNNADTINGAQISGVVNKAKRVKGVQIGIFNYTDSLKGLQIGLVNYAKNGGFNAIELSTNELNTYNIAYKSGGRKFYMALIAGISPKSKGNIWSYGGGVGTMPKLNNWSDLNIEALHRHVNIGSYSNFRQEWVQLGVYWNIHLNKRFELTVGPSYNALFMDSSVPQFAENRAAILPSFIKRTQQGSGRFVADTWVGGNVGLKIKM
jgi:hypothetical protein